MSDWQALGLSLLAIVILGLFEKTRTLAIVIAIALGGFMVLRKASGR